MVGERADGVHGVPVVPVVGAERRPAPIAVMVRSKPKPATPKPVVDGARGVRAVSVVVGERRPAPIAATDK